jgi:hypothetical protein
MANSKISDFSSVGAFSSLRKSFNRRAIAFFSSAPGESLSEIAVRMPKRT